MDRPYFDENGDCTCPVYQYQCSVLYQRSKEKNGNSSQVRDDHYDRNQATAKHRYFFGFTNAISEVANERITKYPNLRQLEVLGLTSEDLFHSIKIQKNVGLQSTLQKTIGPLKRFKIQKKRGTP